MTGSGNSVSGKKKSNLVNAGQITTVFGVKGWLKVHSHTDPVESLLDYPTWWLKTSHGVKEVEITEGRPHGPGLVVHIKGIDDRDKARELSKVTIAIERDQMPDLGDGEFYWHQLVGLKVYSDYEGQSFFFGTVDKLLETGANDVLVVKACDGSMDDSERLIPYVPEQFITDIDLDKEEIRIAWDPEF